MRRPLLIVLGLALGLAGTVAAAPVIYQSVAFYVPLQAAPEPATPATGVTLFAEDRGEWSFLAVMGKSGRDYYMMPHVGYDQVSWAQPTGGATGTTAPQVFGMTVSADGTTTTVSNPQPASTNFMTASTRVAIVSTNTAGSSTGWRAGSLRYWRGNAAGLGGFRCIFRWCHEAVAASSRGLVGLTASTSARANQDPSSDLNFVGAFWNSADSAMKLGGNDGTGTATATTTCSSTDFPPRTANQCFHLEVSAVRNASQISLYLDRLDAAVTPCTATITASADMPANTQFLAPRIHQQITSTTTTQVSMQKMLCEQDN